jgi:hypothetical protein
MLAQPNSAMARVAAIFSVGACLYLIYWCTLYVLYGSYDTGWLLQVGQHILDKGIPRQDVFSWTHANLPYVAYQWLFAAGIAQVFRWGTLWLVGLFCCIGATLLALFVLPRLWVSKGIPLYVALAFAALTLTPHWFNARPQLCSFYLTLLFIGILERFRNRGATKFLFALPLLMVLWVNLHSFWFVGLLSIIVYLAVGWQRTGKPALQLALCLIASCAAVLINPYGINLPAYLATFVNNSQYMDIWELKPWFTQEQFAWTIFYLPIAAVLLWRHRSKVPREGFILSGCAAIAALFMRRFEPMAVLMSWSYLGYALAAIDWSSFQTGWKLRLHPVAHALGVVIFATIGWLSHFPSVLSATMIYTDNTYPLLSIFQSHLTDSDRIFNDATTGSWLIAMGRAPVFIDSRLDMYPKNFVVNTVSCLDGKNNWAQYLDTWGITQIITRDDVALSQQLLISKDWLLVMDDGLLNWWIRNTPQAQATLSNWQLSDEQLQQSTLPPYILKQTVESRCVRYLQMSRFLLTNNQPQAALAACRQGLELMPQSHALRQQTALCGTALNSKNPL